jgi:hypothetical protein
MYATKIRHHKIGQVRQGRKEIHKNLGRGEQVIDTQNSCLIPWSSALPEKLTVIQLVKKFPTYYGTKSFIGIFHRMTTTE